MGKIRERPGERKFLGFRLDRRRRIGIAPESLAKFKAKVREPWDARRNRNGTQLRDEWNQHVRGWWGYFELADVGHPLRDLERWCAAMSGNASGCDGMTVAAGCGDCVS